MWLLLIYIYICVQRCRLYGGFMLFTEGLLSFQCSHNQFAHLSNAVMIMLYFVMYKWISHVISFEHCIVNSTSTDLMMFIFAGFLSTIKLANTIGVHASYFPWTMEPPVRTCAPDNLGTKPDQQQWASVFRLRG